jgi:hypothetical protein
MRRMKICEKNNQLNQTNEAVKLSYSKQYVVQQKCVSGQMLKTKSVGSDFVNET